VNLRSAIAAVAIAAVVLLAVLLTRLGARSATSADPELWTGATHVQGRNLHVTLSGGDRYELCLESGDDRACAVLLYGAADVDARLQAFGDEMLVVVLAGVDRPLRFDRAVGIPLGEHPVHGAVVPVPGDSQCVSLTVPNPDGGTTQLIAHQPVEAGEQPAATAVDPDTSCISID
jgi:hypothetical protein